MPSEEKIIIDLSDKTLNEGLFTWFAKMSKLLLGYLFDDNAAPSVSIKGTPAQVTTFSNALHQEKKYMDAYIKHGLNDERTLSNKSSLNRAVRAFEKETGLHWPFSN